MHRIMIGLGLTLALAGPAVAQDPAGVWHSLLATPGGDLKLAVSIRPTSGGYAGELINASLGKSLPIDEVRREQDRLSFSVPAVRARFEGRWDAARSAWDGRWIQGQSLTMVLEKGDLPAGPVLKALDGDWSGQLATPGGVKLRLVLHVRTGPYGTIAAIDSPDQLAYGIPVSELNQTGSRVSFAQPRIAAAFSGELSADGKSLKGVFTQGGAPMPLTFAWNAPEVALNRPQTPKPPFPYRAEEVVLESAPGVRLAGTLTIPAGKGPFPAVVLITGSGPQDRDETLLGHKPFLVLADHLSRRGVAVLRYDDRGVAKSTGDFSKAVTRDHAVDAAAAFRYLRARPEIDAKKVGLIGHSEGGVVAPMVAAAEPDVGFLVLLAAPGVPMSQLMTAQRLAISTSIGMDAKQAGQLDAVLQKAVAAMDGASTPQEARARAVAAMKADAPQMPDRMVEAQAEALSSDWFRQLMAYDPGPNLRRLRIPVLALGGSRDKQVVPEQNLPALRAALKDDPDATVIELPGLNHLFQTAPTGAIGEYADIPETMAPAALATISDWITARAGR